MQKERLIAFTDAVLAIIMTILVLELEKPAEASAAAFWELRWNFFAYALSFFWLGSLWVGLNSIWEKVENVSSAVIWWNMALLFAASLIPYATSLVSVHFQSRMMQGVYGIVVIVMTAINYILHKVIDQPNRTVPELLSATAAYRSLLLPDILIKAVGMIITLTIWPPAMMFAVLLAAAFILLGKHFANQVKEV